MIVRFIDFFHHQQRCDGIYKGEKLTTKTKNYRDEENI